MFNINIPKRWDQWLKALIAAVVSGFSNTVLSALGISAANTMGAAVHPMDWKQMISLGLSGAFIGALLYLKQSPVPPDPTGNTEIITKQKTP